MVEAVDVRMSRRVVVHCTPHSRSLDHPNHMPPLPPKMDRHEKKTKARKLKKSQSALDVVIPVDEDDSINVDLIDKQMVVGCQQRSKSLDLLTIG